MGSSCGDSGIRATVEFHHEDVCPITDLSARAGTMIESVSVSVCAAGCTKCMTEFTVPGDTDEPGEGFVPVFSYGSSRRYRIVHHEQSSCPCSCLGEFGCPVDKYVADKGTLTLVFYAVDFDELREVIRELRDRFPRVDIKQFIRSPVGDPAQDDVFVDRSRLTSRQLEVLQTAFEMGYYARPRRANATEIAAELGIDPSTFSEHLAAAQTKIFRDVLADRA